MGSRCTVTPLLILQLTDLSSVGFIPQMPAISGAGPGWSQEPGTQPWSPKWVTGIQVLEPSAVAFQGTN